MKTYTEKRSTFCAGFRMVCLVFLVVVPMWQCEAAAEEFPINKSVSGQVKFEVQLKTLKKLERTEVFTDGPAKATVSAKADGFTVWAMDCEIKVDSSKKRFSDLSLFEQNFDPKWFRLQWDDVHINKSQCEVVGWRQDGKGLPNTLFASNSTTEFVGKGQLIFIGSSEGRKLLVQFISSESVRVELH